MLRLFFVRARFVLSCVLGLFFRGCIASSFLVRCFCKDCPKDGACGVYEKMQKCAYMFCVGASRAKGEKMPQRLAVAELAKLLSVLSHRDRIQIVECLRGGERDVNYLQEALGVSHSRVSQHLSRMRASRMVVERREGRHVYYHLKHPRLALWLMEGLSFLEADVSETEALRDAIEQARLVWSEDADEG
jgi:DNA-binding transcriptional ArsR family regulator